MARDYLEDPPPDFDRLTPRAARRAVADELHFWLTDRGRRLIWEMPRVWEDGVERTPEEMLAEGRYREVWLWAASGREAPGGHAS